MIYWAYGIGIGILSVYGLNQLWLAWRFAHYKRIGGNPLFAGSAPVELPNVTVQLPVYNERYVVERIIDACAQLDYPSDKLEIQVLDDSTDDSTSLIAARIALWRAKGRNVVHVRRPVRDGFKAGALDHGLRTARGELIAVFDADFVPPQDFIRRLLPHFTNPRIGMVQARWAFLNEGVSFLTRLQALSLDAHFAVEQFARNRAACFMNFNGTAGIWRRSCIDDAGGWQGDTLTEDLDLSYRAQLKGWSFVYDGAVAAPSELPVDMNAIRTQQFRWAKGSVQTARKLLGSLAMSRTGVGVRLQGFFHLTGHLVFPVVLIVACLHAPLIVQKTLTGMPGDLYFFAMSIGLLALLAVVVTQVCAQKDLHSDWSKRILHLPLFLAGSLGLALNNTIAVADAMSGRTSAFVRTPKNNSSTESDAAWWKSSYADVRVPVVAWIELGLAIYALAGLVLIMAAGQWIAVPFQALFACGFGLVSLSNLTQLRIARNDLKLSLSAIDA